MNVSLVVAFLFFLTLSTDLIHIDISIFKLKLTHIIGLFTLLFIVSIRRRLFLQRNVFLCFSLIFLSMVISSVFSVHSTRSLAYSFVWIFVFFAYFLSAVNLMQGLEENKLLKAYLASYYLIGSYAAAQFFCSIFGVILPFSVQNVIFVRGSGFAHEASFYALYAIPIVSFINSQWLFSPKKSIGVLQVIFANLFLIVSTSTTALLSYLVFFGIAFCVSSLKAKLIRWFSSIAIGFALVCCAFYEMFKHTFLKFFYAGLVHESFQDRLKGITSAMKLFFQYPLFGVGLGGVGPYLALQRFCPAYTGEVTDAECVGLEPYNPTNVCTEILASLGLFGFLCFLALIVIIFRTIRQVLRKKSLLPQERVNLLSFFISTAVMLVCLQVNQGLFRSYIWVHLGLGFGYALKYLNNLKRIFNIQK